MAPSLGSGHHHILSEYSNSMRTGLQGPVLHPLYINVPINVKILKPGTPDCLGSNRDPTSYPLMSCLMPCLAL